MAIFTEITQTILKYLWNHERSLIANVILRKKKKTGGITLRNFKLHIKSTVTKIIWYWHKNRHINQWNINKSSEINPHVHNQLTF